MNYCESDDNSIKFILQIEKLTIFRRLQMKLFQNEREKRNKNKNIL